SSSTSSPRMHPIRRPEYEFDDNGEADDKKARDQDDEYRRAVARIGGAVVEAANAAALREIKKAGEQLPLPAARTASAQSRDIGRGRRKVRALGSRLFQPPCSTATPAPHT